jgi:hypothetical protein
MAYSDYGGLAYRNGKRIEERSDAVITPEGDLYSTPGQWPGWSLYFEKGKEVATEWPSAHALLGDGPIFVGLYKQSALYFYRGFERVDETQYMTTKPDGSVATYIGGKTGEPVPYIDTEYFSDLDEPCCFEIDGIKIVVYWTQEDNYYQYVCLTQPDGTIWAGWSGYGVGEGFDGDYGYSNAERDRRVRELFPQAFAF